MSRDFKVRPTVNGENLALASEASGVAASTFDANTILKADSDNTPVALSVAEQRIVGRKTGGSITALTAAEVRTLADVPSTGDVSGSYVAKSLYDANTILASTSDDTPAALTVGASTLVGRKASGNIAALSVAEAQALLSTYIDPLKPSAAINETFPRRMAMANQAMLLSQRLNLVGIWLPTGTTITSISFVSATTQAGSPTHQIFGLYDSSRALLRATTDDTNTAWSANTIKTLNLTSTFLTTYTGFYYLGIMVQASTVPSLTGLNVTSSSISALAPVLSGSSTTGLTTSLPDPAAAPTGVANVPYAYVS